MLTVADVSKTYAGKKLFIEMADVVKRAGQGFVDYQWAKPGAEQPSPKLSYVVGFAPWGWIIGTGLYVDDIHAKVVTLRTWLLSIMGVLIVALGGVVFNSTTIAMPKVFDTRMTELTSSAFGVGALVCFVYVLAAIAQLCVEGAECAGRDREVKEAVRSLTKKLVRKRVVEQGIRIDGRGPKDLRPISSEVGVLATAHGIDRSQRADRDLARRHARN